MKKTLLLLLGAATSIAFFTSCEDVPEPYNIPTENGGNNTPTADYILNQTFTSSLGDFQSQSESGSLAWTANSRYGAIITGYDDWDGSGTKSNKPGVTYLISPEIDLSETDSAYVSIDQAINYAKTTLADDHHLLIRLGEASSWTELPMSLDGLGTSFTYVSQNIQLPDEYIGNKIQLALKHIAHDTYSSTWEVKSLKVAKGQAPVIGGGDTPVIEGVGSGTKEDPYDVPTTIKLIAAGPPSTKIYTKGIVSKIDEISEQFGNATYYISNDGSETDQLEVYRGLGLGGEKFKADGLKVGDEVIVCGVVVYYNNKTMEFTQGSELYSLNGVTAGGDEPAGEAKGTGTLEDPLNSVAANNIANALASGAKTDQAYYIKGKVVSVKEQFSAQYGNASFYISDDGTSTDQFYIFRALYLGNQKWVSGNAQLKAGDEVVVYAKLTNYMGNTPETVQGDCYVYSINGKTEDDGSGQQPEPEPEPGNTTTLADFTNGDFESWENGKPTNWESSSSKSTLSQSTTAHGGQYSCQVEYGSQNQRLAYKDLTLEPGTYTVSAYVRAANKTAVARIGYHANAFTYGPNTDVTTEWQQLTYTFELSSSTSVSLLLMNSASGADKDAILVDDYTITKN